MRKLSAAILLLGMWTVDAPVWGQTQPAAAKTAQEKAGTGGIPATISNEQLLTFGLPTNPNRDQEVLAADIMALDHRAHEQLGAGTQEWTEVLGILKNAATVGLFYGDVSQGRLDYTQAQEAFFRHVEAKNRLKYLAGLLVGVLACTVLSGLLYLIARSLSEPFIRPRLLPLLCLFAGMGSLTSVLTRLSTIDLKLETDTTLIWISGGTRPVVAVFFALVVYLILDLKLLDIQFGKPTEENRNAIYLISSFLCGFSERFAQDILSTVAGRLGG